MENRDKVNLVNQQGKLLGQKYHGDFVKFSLENSNELLTNVKKYINSMIQNYYYPS